MKDDKYFHIKDLKVTYNSLAGSRTVLDIKELSVDKGETYGIIGESGTGKTVLAVTILKLLETPPGSIDGGSIYLDGEDLLTKSSKDMQQKIRGKKISMIFQDPMSTLNPVFTVKEQMLPVICENQKVNKKEAYIKALEMLNKVKLPDAKRIMNKYPHELSGGQRQRIIIALALVCKAEFIIADEPTRNLDVTIQAGILKLLKELQREFNITVLFISNNPSLVTIMCDRAAVLYAGEIVEIGTSEEIIQKPCHPYTVSLLNFVPKDDKTDENTLKYGNKKNLEGYTCAYCNKCPLINENCKSEMKMINVENTHYVKCNLANAAKEGGSYE